MPEGKTIGLKIEDMNSAKERFEVDLADAQKRFHDAKVEVDFLVAVEGEASEEEFAPQDRALSELSRLEGFRSKGQVPVGVEVTVFHRKIMSFEVGRPRLRREDQN